MTMHIVNLEAVTLSVKRQTVAADGALYVHNVKGAKLVHFPCRWECCIETFTQPFSCIGGIVHSIAASQAVDPGSIPGQCNKATYRSTVSFHMS